MKTINKLILSLMLLIACAMSMGAAGVEYQRPDIPKNSTSIYIANDLGRNGYYEQKTIAELMGWMAEDVDPEFVAAIGDVHHFEGVQSVSDPLWMTNYELIYSHPDLMLDWFPVMGNHEYRGNTQAVLDYKNVSRRWSMPGRYYSFETEVEDGNEKILFGFIDTTPLIAKYRKDGEDYPDAGKQSIAAQLEWLEKTLSESTAKWKIVFGHHPVFAYTSKSDTERKDMQARVKPLLDKYGVDAYVCGHIHNFQHIRPAGSKVEYLVNTAGSLSRSDVKPIDGTVFCNGEPGFTVLSVSDNLMRFFLYNYKGEIVHQFEIKK